MLAGPDEVTSLFSGALDAAYLGPGPAINAWQRSPGQAIRITSGAASGGAPLVVRKAITLVADLTGKTLPAAARQHPAVLPAVAWADDRHQDGGVVHRRCATSAESSRDR